MPFVSNIKSHLALYDESTWGTKPGSPTYIAMPCNSYGVRLQREQRRQQLFTGLRQRKHGRTKRATVSGTIEVPMFGWLHSGMSQSLAEYLYEWAFDNRESTERASKGAEWAEGPDTSNKGHHGLRVDSANLQGSEDGGIQLSLEVIGQDEDGDDVVTTAQTIPTDLEKLIDFEFEDATFEIDDGAGGALATTKMSEFSYQTQHNLKGYFHGKARIQQLPAVGECAETFSFKFPKEDDLWDAFRRSNDDTFFVGKLTLKGLHNGSGSTGTWTKVVIDFPCMRYINHEDDRSRDEMQFSPAEFDLLKPG